MDDTTFFATWDDTGNTGTVNLTKAELKEFTRSTGADKGEHITSMFLKKFIGIMGTVRSQTRDTNGNRRPCIQIETEV